MTNSAILSPTYVPETVDEVQDIVRSAITDKSEIQPIGGGTQVYLADIAETSQVLSAKALNKIIEYEPRDLVVVAEAGMTLASLQSVLRENGQTLLLEVAHPELQTLGGIVASKAPSLTRGSNGSVRDLLIGCHAVNGLGELVVAGGKVVKNVAGYDLPKLYCGSNGSLGVITQVAFKLAPLPQHSRLLLMTLSSERNSEEVLDALSQSTQTSFTYLLGASAAREILGTDTPPAQFLAIGFDGHDESIEAMAAETVDLIRPFVFQTIDLPDHVAKKFRSSLINLTTRNAALRLRCSVLPSQVGAFARMLEWTANRAGLDSLVFADAVVGTIWAQIFSRDEEQSGELEDAQDAQNLRWMRLMTDLRDKCSRVGGTTVIESMPQIWFDARYPKVIPVGDELAWSRKIKAELDPHGVFP